MSEARIIKPEDIKDRGNKFVVSRAKSNERGVALIIALIMLMLLGILGAWALSTSTTELRITGNYRNSQNAFYAADAAVEYGQAYDAIYSAIVADTANVNHVCPPACTGLSAGSKPGFINVPGLGTNSADVKVEWILKGDLPPGGGYSAEEGDKFQANYFAVTSAGYGPNKTEVDIESRVARVVPK